MMKSATHGSRFPVTVFVVAAAVVVVPGLMTAATVPWLPSAFVQGGSAFAQTVFLQDLEDMPLVPGLAEIDSERVMFDKPEGRIVRTAAEGIVTGAAVQSFYTKTLPSLGWTAVPSGAETPNGRSLWFDREGERLEIRWESGPTAPPSSRTKGTQSSKAADPTVMGPAMVMPKLLVRFALQPR